MYKRILLPLDGSRLAEQALPHAIAQCKCFGAELILLRVLKPLPSVLDAARWAEDKTEIIAREYLDRIADRVREEHIPVQVVTMEGRPHEEIVRFAESKQVDLLVMSARGQSGVNRWMIGTVADRVVRGAGVSVLLIRVSDTTA